MSSDSDTRFATDQKARESAFPMEPPKGSGGVLNGYGMNFVDAQWILGSVRASVLDLLDAMGLFDDSGKVEPST